MFIFVLCINLISRELNRLVVLLTNIDLLFKDYGCCTEHMRAKLMAGFNPIELIQPNCAPCMGMLCMATDSWSPTTAQDMVVGPHAEAGVASAALVVSTCPLLGLSGPKLTPCKQLALTLSFHQVPCFMWGTISPRLAATSQAHE